MTSGSKRARLCVAAILAALFAFVVIAHGAAHRVGPTSATAGWTASADGGVDGALGCALCQNAISQARVVVLLAPAGTCFEAVRPLISTPRLPSEPGASSSRGPPAAAIVPIA